MKKKLPHRHIVYGVKTYLDDFIDNLLRHTKLKA